MSFAGTERSKRSTTTENLKSKLEELETQLLSVRAAAPPARPRRPRGAPAGPGPPPRARAPVWDRLTVRALQRASGPQEKKKRAELEMKLATAFPEDAS